MSETKISDLVGKIIEFRGTEVLVTTDGNSENYILVRFPFGNLCRLDKNFGDCLERNNGRYDFPTGALPGDIQPEMESFTQKENTKRYNSLREQWNKAKTQTL